MTTETSIFEKLRAPFTGDELAYVTAADSKDKKSKLWAPYVDARAIQDRLDAVVGPENWTVTYEPGPSGEADYMATLSLRVGPNNGQTPGKSWVSKTDGAGAPAREAVKGGYSTAFRRVAVLWGIGRYLYAIEGVWLNSEIPPWEVGPHVWKRLPGWAVPPGSRDEVEPPNAHPGERSDSDQEAPRPWLTKLCDQLDRESLALDHVRAFLQVDEATDWRMAAYSWLQEADDGKADSPKARALFVTGVKKLVREPASVGND